MQPSCRVSETFAGPGSQTLLAAASRLIAQTGVNRVQLTAIETVVALPMATAGLAVRHYLVRALTLGAVTEGEGESVKFENTGGG
jgi:ABC-type glycerol-3-phosphate transport system permease component